ncbi:MAG: 1-deoxy-D-xylulose-5-phosphate synthase [Phycisphaerales bacterium]|nr:1-deoxy-D-xylulose-5-phosphate synthase [Phycisphaerae bacterium]NNF44681.1 1-deoxy-D-xylulose-5-phosphate synthase [Phycisphaerales bacterium]NNM27839.1 1-deoxy-D-xylulose-5-phosphate synthase [Phycisphaerales bacterium]
MQLTLLPRIQGPADLKALSVDELPTLAAEIRHAICEQIKLTGGHFAPNLGVVELTIALHYVFDFGHDRLLFDVGHQCYPHKLLTGRYPMLSRLRQRDGMAGFPEPRESDFDLFSVGHAGTGVSTAVGMARGDLLNTESYDPESRPDGRRVVTLVGDASIVNGVAMEGLNNAGTLKRQFLVVLNDNGMSIAKPQGAVASYFDRVRVNPAYLRAKRAAKDVVSNLPGGSLIGEMYHRLGEIAKDALAEDAWFEKFGLLTVGPVDGHDVRGLIDILLEVRDFDRPMVLHVHTVKGKGYEYSEGDATTFHSPKPFRVDGCRVELKSSGRSFTTAFADALGDVMMRDDKVVACTAAMPDGTGLSKVMPKFPDRTWDTGICESHAMDMMAGLAKTGWKPFFAVYSTFVQRAFDQAFQEVALQGLPVRLCLDRAGLVGGDGAVHHGFCDVSILRVFPQAILMAAMDEPSLRAALELMRTYDDGISVVRYPRDNVSERFTKEPCPAFEIGKARVLSEVDGPDAAILGYGVMAIAALDAVEQLNGEYKVSVYDARFARPVDIDLLRSLLERGIPVVTVEDHGLEGGFGSCVVDAAADAGLDTRLITRMGIPDRWIYQGARDEQLEEAGIDVASIARTVRRVLDRNGHPPPVVETVRATRETV